MAATYFDIPKKELASLFNQGYPKAWLASKYNCSVSTINNRLRELGLTQRSPRKMQHINLPEVKRLYEQEYLPISMIADRLRCSESGLRSWLKENGVKLRSPRESQKLYKARTAAYRIA